MLYIGLLCGVITGNIASRKAGMDPLRVYIATLVLMIPALAGARLLFVVTNWNRYCDNPTRIWSRKEGGASMYGGLPLALTSSVPLLHALRLNFDAFWDVASFTILVAMILTRAGCLLNGCCCGRTSQSWFAVRLPGSNGEWGHRLPTQIFEAATAAGLLILAALCWKLMPFPGALFLFVTLGYSAARFAMEFAREPEHTYRGLRLGHAMSAVALFSSSCALIVHWQK